MPDKLERLARQVLDAYIAAHRMLTTAESCTGGMVCAALTDIAGSSAVVERGFVTYSNAAKSELLGVDPEAINRYGAVSSEVAAAMAKGALSHSHAAIAVSVTGIAGPGGGSDEKPVGLVWFGLSGNGETVTEHHIFSGNRAEIRHRSTERALQLLLSGLSRFG